jgi:hypothetical protein
MYAPMYLQITLMTEGLITNIAAKWLFPIMFVLMCPKIKLLTE